MTLHIQATADTGNKKHRLQQTLAIIHTDIADSGNPQHRQQETRAIVFTSEDTGNNIK
jgi:hypothetical protein